jgi:hypothetical protein
MRITFFNLKLKQDFDRILILHWTHFSIITLIYFFKLGLGEEVVSSLLKITLIVLFYKLYFKTVKELYYTFWTFSLISLVFLSVGFLKNQEPSLSNFYILGIIFLLIECYMLASPVYFPRVRWWEYDFRFKDDLKIDVITDLASEEKVDVEGRLTDLRRGAGCVVLFDDLKVGQKIIVKAPGRYRDINLESEIMSKREYLRGRGINYGVKFLFESPSEKESYENLRLLWKKQLSNINELKKEEHAVSPSNDKDESE